MYKDQLKGLIKDIFVIFFCCLDPRPDSQCTSGSRWVKSVRIRNRYESMHCLLIFLKHNSLLPLSAGFRGNRLRDWRHSLLWQHWPRAQVNLSTKINNANAEDALPMPKSLLPMPIIYITNAEVALPIPKSLCLCQSPGTNPSILRHCGIWWAADEALLNKVHNRILLLCNMQVFLERISWNQQFWIVESCT
jgi:hypothetical protein